MDIYVKSENTMLMEESAKIQEEMDKLTSNNKCHLKLPRSATKKLNIWYCIIGPWERKSR